MVGAFEGDDGRLDAREHRATSSTSRTSRYYKTSIEVSVITALLGGALGLADRVRRDPRRDAALDPLGLSTFSGVAANFGGIPLAFAFIATIGTIGIVTQFLRDQLHWNIYRTASRSSRRPVSRSSTSTSRSR